MPVSISAKKALRLSNKRRLINLKVSQKIKKTIKLFKLKPSQQNYSKVASALDKAAKKNVIHKRKSSRLKSKLAKLIKAESSSKVLPKRAKKLQKK